jgi:hypothetical protein
MTSADDKRRRKEWCMRAVIVLIVVVLGGIVLWFGARAVVSVARPPDANALIAPLLPQGEGRSVCLAGSFTDRRARPRRAGAFDIIRPQDRP